MPHLEFVLLRGLARQSGHWGEFPKRLSIAFPQATIHTPDLPGFGKLSHLRAPVSIEATAAYLSAEVHLKTDSTKILVAISLGGSVALSWCHQKPDLFTHCFLINSSLAGLSPTRERLSRLAVRVLLGASLTKNPSKREALILGLVSNKPSAREEALPLWTKLAESDPRSAVNILRQLVAASRFRLDAKPEGATRFHVLASTEDRLCSSRCSEQLAELLGGQVQFHRAAGHDLPLDDPEWLAGKIADQVLKNK